MAGRCHARPCCQVDSMSTQELSKNEGTAADHLPNDVLPLGVDEADSAHLYTRREHTVVVETPSGRVEQRIELNDRPLEDWISYVEMERGWVTLNYASCFSDVLEEALQ